MRNSSRRPIPAPTRFGVERLEDRTVPAVQPLGPAGLSVYATGPSVLTLTDDAAYFLGSDSSSNAPTLWKTDGTSAGTTKLAADPAFGGLTGLTIYDVAAAGDTVYFTASMGGQTLPPIPPPPGAPPGVSTAINLWKLDPSATGGVTQVTDVDVTSGVANPRAAGNRLFFAVHSQSSPIPGPSASTAALWVTDGTALGTGQVATFDLGIGGIDLFGATAVGDDLYFTTWSSNPSGFEQALWTSDGTAAGTERLTGPGSAASDLTSVTGRVAVDGRLFFTATDDQMNGQLWVADGDDVTLLESFDAAPPIEPPIAPPILPPIDPAPGGPPAPPPGAPIPGGAGYLVQGLTMAGDDAIFVAPTETGLALWTSDGTSAGTAPVFDSTDLPAGVSGLGTPMAVGDTIIFTATDTTHGTELWRYSDGAVSLLKDVSPGAGSSGIMPMGTLDGRAYFAANDGTTGWELWATDGTASGTVRLTDVNPGLGASAPSQPRKVNGQTLITAVDGGNGGPKLFALVDAPAGAATTTTLADPGPGTTAGRPVTLTATVTAPGGGTPTGEVMFRNEWLAFGTAPLVNGRATFTIPALAPLPQSLQAVYLGDATFAGSPSAPATFTVTPMGARLAVTASDTTPDVLQAVTLTATVTATEPGGPPATGGVTFLDGFNLLGIAQVVNGVATLPTQWATVGARTVSVIYTGDGVYTSATSAGLPVQVSAATTSALGTSLTTAAVGQAVTLTARVTSTGGSPTGPVTFKDGSRVLGTATVGASGAVTFSTAGLTAGRHTLTAVFGGTPDFRTSTSGSVTVTVLPATATSLKAAPVAAVHGQPITLTATVAPKTGGSTKPGGSVTFKDGTTTLGTASLVNGVATLTLPRLAVGNHSLSAEYGGNGQFAKSATSPAGFVVWRAPTAIVVRSSSTAVNAGQPVMLTAAITAASPGTGTPTGRVAFFDGSTEVGSVAIANGSAVLTGVKLPPGVRRIMAVYRGDDLYRTSNSTPIQVTVRTATQTVVEVPPSVYGQAVPLRATVTALAAGASRPGGRVTFRDGTRVLGTANLYHGSAHLTVTGLSAGGHAITATFDANNEFLASTSAPLTYTVGKGVPGLSLVVASPAPTANSPVTLRATVRPAGSGLLMPTGKVTFKDGGRTLGTVDLTPGGVAVFTATLSKGNHTLGASYTGDGRYMTWYTPVVVSVV